MQRYAEPRCEPLGSIGAPCRMGAEAENKTLYFPHMTMECDNVYMQFCPCAGGLVCHEAECRPARKRPVSINRRLYNSWTRMRLLRQQQQQQQQQNEWSLAYANISIISFSSRYNSFWHGDGDGYKEFNKLAAGRKRVKLNLCIGLY